MNAGICECIRALPSEAPTPGCRRAWWPAWNEGLVPSQLPASHEMAEMHFFFSCEMFQLSKHCVSQTKHAYWPHPGHRLSVCVSSLLEVPFMAAAQPCGFEEGDRAVCC